MIGVRIKGRLGNQLFIYAFARAMQEKYKKNVIIYDRKDEDDKMWHSHLDGYCLSPTVKFTSSKSEIMQLSIGAKVAFFLDRIHMKYRNPRDIHNYQMKHFKDNVKKGLFLLMDGYHELPDYIPEDIFCDGYFQSARYFDKIRNLLLTELVPNEEFNEQEQAFLARISNTESVCLTIRLGDYINNSVHQVCNKDYYFKAMIKMRELHPNCTFYVFSDEVERAAKEFNFPYPVIYDSGKSKDVMSLYLMAKCKHFIISNSSFSWWAQYLSQNANKTVISPAQWYATDVPCDIMQDNWIKLHC